MQANGSAPKTRQRGNGPVQFEFENANGSRERRASNPSKLFAKDTKSGEIVTIDIRGLSEDVLLTLAAQGFARQLETYVRNHAEDEGETIVGLIKHRSGEIKAGEFYVRSAVGGGRGRVADVTPWVEAFGLMFKKLNRKPMDEGKLAAFRMKLEAMSGQERNAWIAKLKKDSPHFKQALLEVSAKMAAEQTKSVKSEVDFDALLA